MKVACGVDGCALTAHARGFCIKHYCRWKKYGDPFAGGTPKGEPWRFFQDAMAVETDDCVDWPFGTGQGYGEVQYGGRTHIAPTLMCKLKHGPKPTPKHETAHSCGRRICTNHRHVRWATRAENIQDSIKHGTRPRGEGHPHAKLAEADVREIRRLRGTMTQDQLAERFGVHRAHVKDLQMRRRWAWLQ